MQECFRDRKQREKKKKKKKKPISRHRDGHQLLQTRIPATNAEEPRRFNHHITKQASSPVEGGSENPQNVGTRIPAYHTGLKLLDRDSSAKPLNLFNGLSPATVELLS